MKRLYQIFLGGMAVLLLLSGCGQGGAGQAAAPPSDKEVTDGAAVEPESSAEPEPAAEAVSFEGTDLEGNAVTADILSQSRLTMINVWATYCNPCLSEMPALGELAAEYEAEDFQIIGIVSDVPEGEDSSLAESLIGATGANYTHLLLNESLYYGLLAEVTAVPTTFFLNKDGAVLEVVVGAMEKADWKEKIDAFLEEV